MAKENKKESPNKKKSSKKRIIAGILIIIVGIGICLAPTIITKIKQKEFEDTINSYQNQIEGLDPDDIDDQFDQANQYNEKISSGIDKDGTGDADYENILSFEPDNMMGFIEIPRFNLVLPIYHGTDDSVLAAGVGHMRNTSLPVGGKSTHCVLVGHTGLSYRIFDDLHYMEIGDVFYLKIANRVLKYEVYKIEGVLPNEMSYTKIQEGRDLCTLVTCYPQGINSHRRLIMGERVEE